MKAFGIAVMITYVTDIILVPEIENWKNIFGTLNCVTFLAVRRVGEIP
jgi:hypothetical protein